MVVALAAAEAPRTAAALHLGTSGPTTTTRPQLLVVGVPRQHPRLPTFVDCPVPPVRTAATLAAAAATAAAAPAPAAAVIAV